MFLKKILKHKVSKREWSTKNLSDVVVKMVEKLKKQEMLDLVLDMGAGEGRHSEYALKNGFGKVIAVEIDHEQVEILKSLRQKYSNLEVVEGDVQEYMKTMFDESIDGVIDVGMSHCLENSEEKQNLIEYAWLKLKPNGLYTIVHFSKNEEFQKNGCSLSELKVLFPQSKWDEAVSWNEVSWKRQDGGKYHAYQAVLKKK